MKTNIEIEGSIGAHEAYQQTLGEYVEAAFDFSCRRPQTVEEEHSDANRLSHKAMQSAEAALTATVDAYVARRILQVMDAGKPQ